MTDQRDVRETLCYGKEERLARNAPCAAGLGLLRLVVLFLLRDPDAKAEHVTAAVVFIVAGPGFAVFALWRRGSQARSRQAFLSFATIEGASLNASS